MIRIATAIGGTPVAYGFLDSHARVAADGAGVDGGAPALVGWGVPRRDDVPASQATRGPPSPLRASLEQPHEKHGQGQEPDEHPNGNTLLDVDPVLLSVTPNSYERHGS